jgi:hypothetical protein
MSTTPAAAPVATPAIVPFACCLSGVIVACEVGAVVELGIKLVDDADEVL